MSGNPAFASFPAIPAFLKKRPSKGWTIFLSTVGTLTALGYYDSRETKKEIAKYCAMVEHLASEPMGPTEQPRKIGVFMVAPPGDHIDVAQKHFDYYVKPILNSAAVDYELYKYTFQGGLRHYIANQIRATRTGKINEIIDPTVARIFSRADKVKEDGVLVVGRPAWKEYLVGLHEGYLGPSEYTYTWPAPPENESEDDKKKRERKEKILPPSIQPSQYSSSALEDPVVFEPLQFVQHKHILGFLNTPTRIYRYFNQRDIAKDIGLNIVSLINAKQRPFNSADLDLGVEEQKDWSKTIRQKDGEWMDDLIVDERITSRLSMYTKDNSLFGE